MIADVPDLPLIADGPPPRERADAARNRLRILEAAAKLVDERGIEHVSMEDVACTAGVGTGTLYRRFGDRAGLALALLEEDTREFQNALISGPAPLGPGAPAAQRLQAFGPAYIDLMERHADLLVAAGAIERDGRGPYTLYATHLAILIAEAAPELDAPLTARALLATLGPGQYLHARRALGWEVERIQQGWVAMTAALCASSS
jgi:AcrR family transcriptional regulator